MLQINVTSPGTLTKVCVDEPLIGDTYEYRRWNFRFAAVAGSETFKVGGLRMKLCEFEVNCDDIVPGSDLTFVCYN